jgi:hypothetical protein
MTDGETEPLNDHKSSCAWVFTIYAKCDCGYEKQKLEELKKGEVW